MQLFIVHEDIPLSIKQNLILYISDAFIMYVKSVLSKAWPLSSNTPTEH